MAELGEHRSEARDQYHWQLQSGQVQNILEQNMIPVNKITGSVNADLLNFNIRSGIDRGVSKFRALANDLSGVFGVNNFRLRTNGAGLQLEIERPADVAVPLLDLLSHLGQLQGSTAVLGLAEDGRPVLHDFSSEDSPHLIVLGDRDAGKTVMLRTIAISMAIANRQSDVQFAAICPIAANQERQRVQAAAWNPLNYLPHMLCDVAFRQTEIIELLTFLSQEIAYREKNNFKNPRIVVLIDQVDDVIARGRRKCLESLQLLAQRGEDVGIHLVLSAQSINPNLLTPQLLAEMSVRLFGRSAVDPGNHLSPNNIPYDPQVLLGEGDFYMQHGTRLHRMQGAYINDYDLHLSLHKMYRRRATLLAKPYSTRVRLPQPPEDSVPTAHSNARTRSVQYDQVESIVV